MNNRNKNLSGIIWNTIGGVLVAFQSPILLFLAVHFYSQEFAGIISIGYALAVFIYTFGRYGMRNYQATDLKNKYKFREYLTSRYITICISIVVLLIYLLISIFFNQYKFEKTLIIFEIVLYRLIYAFEDVFCGQLQKMDLFALGARIMTIREAISLFTIIVLMILQVNMGLVFFIGIIIGIITDTILISRIKELFLEDIKKNQSKDKIISLLKECFPLAVGTSFAIYLSNLPKFVTDWYFDDLTQAIVSYLILPVFMISLISQFIYTPFIRNLGQLYNNGLKIEFYRCVLKQTILIALITMLIGIIIIKFGLPVLSIIYNIELGLYTNEMIFFIFGGFLYALQYYLTIPITVLKRQKYMVLGYVGSIFVSFLLQKNMAIKYGIKGVAIVYFIANGIMTLYFLVLIFGLKIKKNEKGVVSKF